jgi:hypothetical protein
MREADWRDSPCGWPRNRAGLDRRPHGSQQAERCGDKKHGSILCYGSKHSTILSELHRRRDNLNGKKLVVWCFSCRELSASYTGWRKVPVIR